MIDLHTHTNCSDGDYSPHDLIDLASSRGLKTISITDHDTVLAYKTDIIEFANNRGIKLIPGIEFSTIDEISHEKIHVVGLDIDINEAGLVELCDALRQARRDAVIKTEELLTPIGFKLRTQEMLDSGVLITKFHIGHDVVTNPENHPKLIDIYGKVPLHGTFIEDYLIKGKPAFVKSDDKLYTSVAVDAIKKAGGVAICAHPSFNIMRGFSFESMRDLIVRNQFDGIESINIQYNKSGGDIQFDMVQEFTDLAYELGLLTSGGSDYHSNNQELWGNHSDLGLSNEQYEVTQQVVDSILNYRRAN